MILKKRNILGTNEILEFDDFSFLANNENNFERKVGFEIFYRKDIINKQIQFINNYINKCIKLNHLDIGTGCGLYAQKIINIFSKKNNLFVLDSKEQIIQLFKFKQVKNISFIVGSFFEIRTNICFNIVTMNSVLQYLINNNTIKK